MNVEARDVAPQAAGDPRSRSSFAPSVGDTADRFFVSTLAWRQTAFDLDSARVLNDDSRPPIFGWAHTATGGGQVPRPMHPHHIFTGLEQRHC